MFSPHTDDKQRGGALCTRFKTSNIGDRTASPCSNTSQILIIIDKLTDIPET
jgi:hypothetical protein